jgi:hypothetical protein
METEGGWWQAPVPGFESGRRPLFLADWCDVALDMMPGRSIFELWSSPGKEYPLGRIGGDRCLGLLTQAVAFPRGILE